VERLLNENGERGYLSAAKNECRNVDLSQISEKAKFEMEITFLIAKRNISLQPDLDNLARPVPNALFPGLFRGLNDNRYFRLSSKKKEISDATEEGANLTITWRQ
jgi:hypothetical protein